jgi:hypothetical protein
MRRLLWSLVAVCVPLHAAARDPGELRLESGRDKDGGFVLAGRDSSQQLLLTSRSAGVDRRDLTRDAAWSCEPAGLVSIGPTGLVEPFREGKGTITARVGARSARLRVTVTPMGTGAAIHFANEVVPVFTKLGCNSGGCHGKASGQNGFKLSLLGFEPREDYEALVKEGRGRRLLPSAPEHSLLLAKASGRIAHGGGRRLDLRSAFYRLLVRWVAQGTPPGRPDDPEVKGIEVFPRERTLRRSAAQQLVVIAHFSDGLTRDVTRLTQFESNQPHLAEVAETGLVTAKQAPGRAAVMARFGSHVAVFRASVPHGVKVEELPPARTFIDKLVFRQCQALGLPPSPVCDDSTFLRRATIDLAGRLPTRKEVDDYLFEKDGGKAEKLVDRLLASGDHADYFANKWSALLRNRRSSTQDDVKPTFAFHAWLRKSIKENRPYDSFVRAILTASGEEVRTPAVVWYRELKTPAALAEDAAQLFLGQRIGCAKCHHHPFEKWRQEDYYRLTAFFSTVRVHVPPTGKAKKPKKGEPAPAAARVASVSLAKGRALAAHPRTGRPLRAAPLGGKVMEIADEDDPREKLADWMAAKDNPFFAKALVNRYWKHFLGRGLVDPEDDMRLTNPPSNPELLDALAREFVASGYDSKKLIRTICTSTVYRLSARANAHNASDRQNHSRFLPRRLHAEVLLDAIDLVTQSRTVFKGAPPGTRAVQLPDNLFESWFLSAFGRPDGASACECERSGEASLAQCLHLLNGEEILAKVAGGRARALAGDKRPHAERLKDLYLVALARAPGAEERKALLAYIEKKGEKVQSAYEDILWALINTREFLFNH